MAPVCLTLGWKLVSRVNRRGRHSGGSRSRQGTVCTPPAQHEEDKPTYEGRGHRHTWDLLGLSLLFPHPAPLVALQLVREWGRG